MQGICHQMQVGDALGVMNYLLMVSAAALSFPGHHSNPRIAVGVVLRNR